MQEYTVTFPCKPGTKVCVLTDTDYKPTILVAVVEKVSATEKGLYMKLSHNKMYETSVKAIGKYVFFDPEEAKRAKEEAITKLRGGR